MKSSALMKSPARARGWAGLSTGAAAGVAAAVTTALGVSGPRAAPANAATLEGKVRLEAVPAGTTPSASVVYVVGFDQDPPPGVIRMAQKDKSFVPDVLAVTRGQLVEFANRDSISHNVFSVSSDAPFDTGITPPGDDPGVRFRHLGAVDVYCNIHPEMAANILVLPNRAFAVTEPDGTYKIAGIPEGEHVVYVWNRLSKPAHQSIKFGKAKAVMQDWSLKAEYAPKPHLNKFGRPYKTGGKY